MNLYSEFAAAYDSLFKRYLKSKDGQLFYIFSAKIGRKEFYTVLSEAEAKKYKINLKASEMVIGQTETNKEYRRKYQEHVNSEEGKKAQLYTSYIQTIKKEQRLRSEIQETRGREEV